MNELLDPQNETHNLAVFTTEELPGYAEWCAEWESEQNPDWAEAALAAEFQRLNSNASRL